MISYKLLEAPRNVKRVLMLVSDLVIIPIAIYLALFIRTDFSGYYFSPNLHIVALLTSLTSSWLFMRFGLYLAAVRFMGHEALMALVKGVTVSTILFVSFTFLIGANLPRSVPIIYWFVAFSLVGGTRFAVRWWVQSRRRKRKTNVAIYGAGATGMELLMSLRGGDKYEPVALLDDSPELKSIVYQGLQVMDPCQIEELIDKKNIEQVLLAMPSIPVWRKKEILQKLEPLAVRVKTVPSVEQLVSGEAKVEQVRDIEIEDLLGRDSVEPNLELLTANVRSMNVLVTGAGGSIGSELCRQIIACEPSKLLLFERCEYLLYAIEAELRDQARENDYSVEIIPLLGCVQDYDRVYSVLEAFKVDTIYHAAAYKHVPMVEQNVVEGVKNNVFGTLNSAQAAAEAKVKTFVLISTDKAVRPTNVMGASKRMAELILQALAKKKSNTCFSMVRFGNVLGSSGSVVPLFKRQIREGGPITVTHPEIIRYFMTIPEAAQLVIQAGAMAKGGDVFVLDMGEPVKIADLARAMVRLMGLEVKEGDDQDGDIEIKYTGLRAGEKLFEELLIGENAHGTAHSRIMRAHEVSLPWEKLEVVLDELKRACDDKDCELIRELLLNSETGYVPSDRLTDLVWQKSQEASANVLNIRKSYPKERAC
ncbi:MAG: nucleoside-diphosphate sugar epimerase/dehydratase [Ketobacteraceae bacterium]|nr:nucleoside-diphosphate sugar epimerase/dehydratase [Ketobacteraceae bacterium]